MKIKHIFIIVLISLMALGFLSQQNSKKMSIEKITYLEMENMVKEIATEKKNEEKAEKKEKKEAKTINDLFNAPVVYPYIYEEVGKVRLVTEKIIFEANLDHRESSGFDKKYDIEYLYQEKGSFFASFMKFALIGLGIYIVFSIFRGKESSITRVGKINKKTKKDDEKDKTKSILLKDVGGLSKETKEQLELLIQMVKNRSIAYEIGVEPDNGYLFHGPPGTGKTLTAKAIANELDIHFIPVSGAEFVEMFVGVGASRVRDLFDEARKHAPSVIFIDELDTIAKKRSNHPGSNDERESTLNQILVEMDGINKDEDIIVIGATNRLDMLDPAIIRDGRFDYKIYMGLPDLKGRKEIVHIHSKNKKLSKELAEKLDRVAEITTGFSGAEIKGLFNKAARKAVSKGKKEIEMEDIHDAYDVILLGNEGNAIPDEKTKERIAYHEAGHALIGVLTNKDSVRKVTIIPRGQAGGYVANIRKDFELLTKSQVIDKISMTLAGGVAENLILGEHSIGVQGDVEQAKNMIEYMVENGLLDKFTITFGDKAKTEEKNKIFQEAYNNCIKMVKENMNQLEKIKNALMEKETLEGEEVVQLVYGNEEIKQEIKAPESKLEEFTREIKEKGKELANKWLKKPKKTT